MNLKFRAAGEVATGVVVISSVAYALTFLPKPWDAAVLCFSILGFLIYSVYQIRLDSLESDQRLREIAEARVKARLNSSQQ